MLLICRHCFLLVTCLWPVEQPRKNGKRSSFGQLCNPALCDVTQGTNTWEWYFSWVSGNIPPSLPCRTSLYVTLAKTCGGKNKTSFFDLPWSAFLKFFLRGVIFIVIIICFFKIRKHPPNGSMCYPISIDVLYWSQLGKFHGNVH